MKNIDLTKFKISKAPWTIDEYIVDHLDRKLFDILADDGEVIIGNEGFFLDEETDRANSNVVKNAPIMLKSMISFCITVDKGYISNNLSCYHEFKQIIEDSLERSWEDIKKELNI